MKSLRLRSRSQEVAWVASEPSPQNSRICSYTWPPLLVYASLDPDTRKAGPSEERIFLLPLEVLQEEKVIV